MIRREGGYFLRAQVAWEQTTHLVFEQSIAYMLAACPIVAWGELNTVVFIAEPASKLNTKIYIIHFY